MAFDVRVRLICVPIGSGIKESPSVFVVVIVPFDDCVDYAVVGGGRGPVLARQEKWIIISL